MRGAHAALSPFLCSAHRKVFEPRRESLGSGFEVGSVRSLVVFFVGIVVANSIPGYAVHGSPPISPDSTTYCVRRGGLAYAVQPVERSQGVASWYNYFSESSHDPFVEAYASVLYLYLDTNAAR